MSRVKNPLGLKIMVCGTDKSRPGKVWIRNVVYREIFDPHSQIEPIDYIDEICSLLNDTFPSSQLPAKRESVLSDSNGKSKVIKLNEFNDNTLIPLESIHVPMDAECVFDGILRDPQDFSQFLLNSSFNSFTIEMRQRLAHSIGIDRVFIQPDRETRRIATSYYISLHRQLMSYLGMNVSLYDVQPDGNCLYRALSHIIFGSEDHYELLKHKLIQTFLASPHIHFNVVQKSGILSEQELREHVNTISARNAWGTNVELSMLGALAEVDILVIDCTDSGVARGGGSRGQVPVVETRVGPLPQYFNIGAPLKSCNGGSTPMMECIVQTYFVSNGYLYITALLLFGHYFVISQYMYSDIFSSFFVNF